MLRRILKLNKKRTAVLCAVVFLIVCAAVLVPGLIKNQASAGGSLDAENAQLFNIVPGDYAENFSAGSDKLTATSENGSEANHEESMQYVTTGDDPQMVFAGPGKHIGFLEISITNNGDIPAPVEVFYALSGTSFDQEHSRVFSMEPGDNEISFRIDEDVDAVRIDPGTAEGVEFSLAGVEFKSLLSDDTEREVFIARTAIIILLIFFVLLHFIFGIGKLYGWMFRRRYFIGIAVVLLCVCLDINGSSIGNWGKYMYVDSDSTAFGESRFFRSDEWAVWTPMMISQQYGDEPFSKYNEILRGTPTDVNMLYALPVKNISLLYRPFLAGFILLGPERGYAFYWSARTVCLFLACLELLLIITKRKKALSAAGALMIVFAPVIQWWYATNALLEMIIFGCTFIAALYSFLYGYGAPVGAAGAVCGNAAASAGAAGAVCGKAAASAGAAAAAGVDPAGTAGRSVSFRTRIVCLILMVISAGGYILTLYPAWMVPFGYVFLALLIWVMFTRPQKYAIKKRDWLCIAAALIFLALTLGFIFYTSLDTIKAVMGTVYPGNRRNYGGDGLLQFVYPASLFFEFNIETASRNTCELSSFITLFPLDIIIGIYCLIRKKGKDLLTPLVVFALLLDVYSLAGVPEFLGDITLLSFSMGRRAAVAAMFMHLLILIRSAAVLKEEGYFRLRTAGYDKDTADPGQNAIRKKVAAGSIVRALVFTAVILIFALAVVRECTFYMLEYMTPVYWVIAFAVLIIGGALYVICVRSEKPFAVFFAALCVITGILVNPVQCGFGEVLDTELADVIDDVADEDTDALWAVNIGFPMNNYPVMLGAKTINCTNTYPDIRRWESVSQKSIDENVYNRYAHIVMTLVSEEERGEMFELLSPDMFQVYLTYDEMKELGVKYYLTSEEIPTGAVPPESAVIKGRAGSYYIYELAG